MKCLAESVDKYAKEGRRMVAPLMGLPGLQMIHKSVKLGQQNSKIHFQTIRSLADTFKPDIVFPMMDLSVEANALGLPALFPEGDAASIRAITVDAPFFRSVKTIDIGADGRARSYAETIRLLREHLPGSIRVGAYISAPYTLAAQIMGISKAGLAVLMSPDKIKQLIELLVPVIRQYASLQIDAGADLVCILDPGAALLNPGQFDEFAVQYVASIVPLLHRHRVDSIYHVCGNTMHVYKLMASSGVTALSLDSREAGVNLTEIAEKLNDDIILMGNLDPSGTLLQGNEVQVRHEVNRLLAEMGKFHNFILSSGCDLPKNTPLANIKAFMETGRKYHYNS